MLLGDATKVPPRDDCGELWFFVQLHLEIPVLCGAGVCVLFVAQNSRVDHGDCDYLRGLIQHVRLVPLPGLP